MAVGVIGILALLAVAVISPLWYILRIQPFDSTYLDNPSCEIQAVDWVQLGVSNGGVELQYADDKIASVLDKCEDGTEYSWVLWTVEDARIIKWGSGATGLWARINTGAMHHHGGALSFVEIGCINTFEHGRPLEVQISPMSAQLEPRDVTFVQETSNGRVECTFNANKLATSAVEKVTKSHASGDYCKAVASSIPVVCRSFDWSGCMAFLLSTWGFVVSIVNFFIKREVCIQSDQIAEKSGLA